MTDDEGTKADITNEVAAAESEDSPKSAQSVRIQRIPHPLYIFPGAVGGLTR